MNDTATLEQLAANFFACFVLSNPAGHSDQFLTELAAETANTALATMQAFPVTHDSADGLRPGPTPGSVQTNPNKSGRRGWQPSPNTIK